MFYAAKIMPLKFGPLVLTIQAPVKTKAGLVEIKEIVMALHLNAFSSFLYSTLE